MFIFLWFSFSLSIVWFQYVNLLETVGRIYEVTANTKSTTLDYTSTFLFSNLFWLCKQFVNKLSLDFKEQTHHLIICKLWFFPGSLFDPFTNAIRLQANANCNELAVNVRRINGIKQVLMLLVSLIIL